MAQHFINSGEDWKANSKAWYFQSIVFLATQSSPYDANPPKNLFKGIKRYHLLEGRASRKLILKFSDVNYSVAFFVSTLRP